MAARKRLPKSVRIHIRRRKAEIRREVQDPKAQKAAIAKLYPAKA